MGTVRYVTVQYGKNPAERQPIEQDAQVTLVRDSASLVHALYAEKQHDPAHRCLKDCRS